MTHLTFEQISELAESPELTSQSAHVRECHECSETLRRVRTLIASARALPREIAPPPEVWPSLRSRIGPLAPRRRSAWRVGGWLAAAAAIVMLVGTAILLPETAGKAKGVKIAAPPSPVVSSVDRSYAGTLAELRRTLDSQRPALPSNTIGVVERSLAMIDTAIAETRDALRSDPANQSLVEILSANYERKVDLLQRATELSSSF